MIPTVKLSPEVAEFIYWRNFKTIKQKGQWWLLPPEWLRMIPASVRAKIDQGLVQINNT